MTSSVRLLTFTSILLGIALLGIALISFHIHDNSIHAFYVSNDNNNASPATRYVSVHNGSDEGDCTSPSRPCKSIQYAVNHAASGDTVLVAEGTYTYQPSADQCSFLQTPAVVCFVDKQLTILGGFPIESWTASNLEAHPTIIDGEHNYRGVAAIGYNTSKTHLQMEKFTIQNAKVQGPTYLNPYDPSAVGGGMLVQHASVTLRDVIFKNNQVYGENTSSGPGGQADGAGLRIEEAPEGTISLLQRVIFDGNQSFGGDSPERGGIAFGALFVYKSAVTIEDSQFINNLAQAGSTAVGSGLGGGLRADGLGGGLAVEQGDITLKRVTVIGNEVRGGNGRNYGGGAYGGGLFFEDFGANVTKIQIFDSYIANNRAIAGKGTIEDGGNAAGGGITSDSASITIERTTVVANSAIGGSSDAGKAGPGAGGGIYLFAIRPNGSQAILRNVVVAHNSVSQGSGEQTPGNGGGGGLVVHGLPAHISHGTFANNRLSNDQVLGKAILIQPWPSPLQPDLPASVTLEYSIVADHLDSAPQAAAVVVQQGSSLHLEDNIFANNGHDINANNFPVPHGELSGLTTTRHLQTIGFVAPEPPYYNYRLRGDAAAKDLALKSRESRDIDNEPRPYSQYPDHGADEYRSFLLSVVPGNHSLYINWESAHKVLQGGVARYEIRIACDDATQDICGQSIPTEKTDFILSGLSSAQSYQIQVLAYDDTGQLLASSEVVTSSPYLFAISLPLVLR